MAQHSTPRTHLLRGAVVAAALVTGLGMGMAHAAGDATKSAEGAAKKTEQVVSDSWITTKVKSELLANKGTKALKVSVKTMHGDVALNGTVPSQEVLDEAKMIAGKVKGVKNVDTTALTVASK